VKGSYEWENELLHREAGTVSDTLTVTELPIGTWVNNYKEFLQETMELQSKAQKAQKAVAKKSKKALAAMKKKKKDDDIDMEDADDDDDDYDPNAESKSNLQKSKKKAFESKHVFGPGDIVDVRCNHTDCSVSFTIKLCVAIGPPRKELFLNTFLYYLRSPTHFFLFLFLFLSVSFSFCLFVFVNIVFFFGTFFLYDLFLSSTSLLFFFVFIFTQQQQIRYLFENIIS
jgi:hypothetical protein